MNELIWKYFKKGDIISGEKGTIWKNKKFKIKGFFGNDYCPLVSAIEYGHEDTYYHKCNFDLREVKLIGSQKRPLQMAKRNVINLLLKKGNIEAKREMIIRVNNKKW